MVYALHDPLSATALCALLQAAFPGADVQVRDDTHLHTAHNHDVGHGGGHFKVSILWDGFAPLTRMQRHRLVYAAVDAPWRAGRIHALSLRLAAPGEAR